jgi:uncharacterized surface protein with fasciclin (FAS1) repeats
VKNRTTPFVLAALVAVSVLAGACSSNSSSSTTTTTKAPSTSSQNIVQIAAGDPQLSTLVAAVKAAGLVGTLEGPGPYTVFAPTNAAFAALPAGTVTTLLEPANKAELTSLLTYHVVPGKVTSSDLKAGPVTTVNGATFTVNSENGTFTITDGKGGTAHFVTTNIEASNGVIHVIDAVLQPAG